MPVPFQLSDKFGYFTPKICAILDGFDTATKLIAGNAISCIRWNMPEYYLNRADNMLEGKIPGGEFGAEQEEQIYRDEVKAIKAGKDGDTTEDVTVLKLLVGPDHKDAIIDELSDYVQKQRSANRGR